MARAVYWMSNGLWWGSHGLQATQMMEVWTKGKQPPIRTPRRSTEEELPMEITTKWNQSVNTIARNPESVFQSIRWYQ